MTTRRLPPAARRKAVHKLAETNMSRRDIAEELGVSTATICRDLARKGTDLTTWHSRAQEYPTLRLLRGMEFERSDSMDSPCWIWRINLTQGGYGSVWWDGKMQLAHRVTYRLAVGPIPEGFEVDHLCRVRNCVNPSHLEAVTTDENRRRYWASRIRCDTGHPLVPPNLLSNSYPSVPAPQFGPGSRCLLCARDLQRRQRDKKRGSIVPPAPYALEQRAKILAEAEKNLALLIANREVIVA